MIQVLVDGAASAEDLPGWPESAKTNDWAQFSFAADEASLCSLLPRADVLLGWNFRSGALERNWGNATRLRWIHWCGAGVDAVLFPALAQSAVVLTNSRGIFDRAMAEYVLAYMLMECKRLPDTLDAQRSHSWNYQKSRKLAGQNAVVVGVGSIGREICRLLSAVGLNVTGVGRNERSGDPDFGHIRSFDGCDEELAGADWVIGVLPGTADTEGVFDRTFFGRLSPHARFINLGRGSAVNEIDLAEGLRSGGLAGAMLDVFSTEPLPASSDLWQCPGLFVSPHMSGDYQEYQADMLRLFMRNLERFHAGQPLENVVNKRLGFVESST